MGYFSRSKEKGKCISYIVIIVRIFLLPGKVGLLLTNFFLSQVVRYTGASLSSLSFCFISLLFLCFVGLYFFLNLKHNWSRLPHLLASSLLYSGRHNDTRWQEISFECNVSRMVFLPPVLCFFMFQGWFSYHPPTPTSVFC